MLDKQHQKQQPQQPLADYLVKNSSLIKDLVLTAKPEDPFTCQALNDHLVKLGYNQRDLEQASHSILGFYLRDPNAISGKDTKAADDKKDVKKSDDGKPTDAGPSDEDNKISIKPPPAKYTITKLGDKQGDSLGQLIVDCDDKNQSNWDSRNVKVNDGNSVNAQINYSQALRKQHQPTYIRLGFTEHEDDNEKIWDIAFYWQLDQDKADVKFSGTITTKDQQQLEVEGVIQQDTSVGSLFAAGRNLQENDPQQTGWWTILIAILEASVPGLAGLLIFSILMCCIFRQRRLRLAAIQPQPQPPQPQPPQPQPPVAQANIPVPQPQPLALRPRTNFFVPRFGRGIPAFTAPTPVDPNLIIPEETLQQLVEADAKAVAAKKDHLILEICSGDKDFKFHKDKFNDDDDDMSKSAPKIYMNASNTTLTIFSATTACYNAANDVVNHIVDPMQKLGVDLLNGSFTKLADGKVQPATNSIIDWQSDVKIASDKVLKQKVNTDHGPVSVESLKNQYFAYLWPYIASALQAEFSLKFVAIMQQQLVLQKISQIIAWDSFNDTMLNSAIAATVDTPVVFKAIASESCRQAYNSYVSGQNQGLPSNDYSSQFAITQQMNNLTAVTMKQQNALDEMQRLGTLSNATNADLQQTLGLIRADPNQYVSIAPPNPYLAAATVVLQAAVVVAAYQAALAAKNPTQPASQQPAQQQPLQQPGQQQASLNSTMCDVKSGQMSFLSD